MSAWLVRQEGTTTVASVPTANAVLAGLRDGTWIATDEVKGPDDREFRLIEAHPAFEEAAAELGEEPDEHPDDTHLDMNPLIDVCLVLLIFFILTITYESLRRSIDVPETPAEKEQKAKPVDYKSIQDRVVLIQARMNGETPVIKVGGEETPKDKLVEVLGKHMGGQPKDVILDVDEFVPWGVQTAILDATKANKVPKVIYNTKRK
jgi:biopolymer transport protein ExbD